MSDTIEAAISAPTHVVATALGSGLALLDLRTNQYFTLNEVGAFVWGFIASPRTKDEILRAMMSEYDVSAETCAPDLDALLEDLGHAALIEQSPART